MSSGEDQYPASILQVGPMAYIRTFGSTHPSEIQAVDGLFDEPAISQFA